VPRNFRSGCRRRFASAALWKEIWPMREIGKLLIVLGGAAVVIGLILWSGFAPKWLGRLPGDIRIERGHSSFYFPIVTCIILSIILSLLFSIFSMFRR
jgi:Protein of unknown function (DUF2905)